MSANDGPNDWGKKQDGGRRAAGNPLMAAREEELAIWRWCRTDRGIMKLLTSKQAAESPADGRADGERAARSGLWARRSTDPPGQHGPMCLLIPLWKGPLWWMWEG